MSKPIDEAFKVFKKDSECWTDNVGNDMKITWKLLLKKTNVKREKGVCCPRCGSRQVYGIWGGGIYAEYNYFCYKCKFNFVCVGHYIDIDTLETRNE